MKIKSPFTYNGISVILFFVLLLGGGPLVLIGTVGNLINGLLGVLAVLRLWALSYFIVHKLISNKYLSNFRFQFVLFLCLVVMIYVYYSEIITVYGMSIVGILITVLIGIILFGFAIVYRYFIDYLKQIGWHRLSNNLTGIIIITLIIVFPGRLFITSSSTELKRERNVDRKGATNQLLYALNLYYNDYGIFPEGNCVSDLENVLVPKYINIIPKDPDNYAKVYGTKIDGCELGDYGYKNLKYQGKDNMGFVLIANTEMEGRRSNFAVGGKGIVNFVSDCSGSDTCYSNQNPYLTGDKELRNSNKFSFDDAFELEKTICDTIEFVGNNKNYFCEHNKNDLFSVGYSNEKNSVYIIVGGK